jgi:hypothetical protein
VGTRAHVRSHNQENFVRSLIDMKRRHSGKKAGLELRQLACEAVDSGLSLREVAEAVGSGPDTVRRWVQRSKVRILQIAEPKAPTPDIKPDPGPKNKLGTEANAAGAIAIFEFGGVTVRLLKR